MLAAAHEEDVVTQRDGRGEGHAAEGAVGSLPGQAVLHDPVGLVPQVVADPEAAVFQGVELRN